MFVKNLKITLGVFIIVFVGLGVFSFGEFISCRSMILGSDNFVGWDLSPQKNKNVRALTQHFCRMVSNERCMHDGDVFDANQSIFLSVLCDNVGMGNLFTGIVREGSSSVLLKTGFKQFGIYDYGFLDSSEGTSIDFCDYKVSNMNGCNYAKHLPKIFDEIMNDFFNIKHADLYGVDQLKDGTPVRELVNNFSRAYFVGLDICDPQSEYYKRTCKYLKNYMKKVKNLLKKTNVINVENLISKGEKDLCEEDKENNLLYCGLLGDDLSPKASFLNVVYNEYLWYRLFISYYSYELSVEPKFSEFMKNDPMKKMDWNMDKVYSFQEKMNRSRQAISVAFRTLMEISNSFPLHIGFLMYQEDAKMFMKELSKLYPPIMTLFDKLRNVQKVN